jgi:hypothetical protein
VSNLGNVKNKSGKIMRTRINPHGYVIINLQKNKVKYTETLHRLVALTFIPNPDNKKCVDHIDNNRQNNNLENLRIDTRKGNMADQIRMGKTPRGEKSSTNKYSVEYIKVIKKKFSI